MTKSNPRPGDELVFLPLGGSNEIGMNFNLYGYGPPHDRKWIIVDLGVTFGDQTTPGVEIILPDPTFIEERAKDILGIVLTHAHEDHIGAVGWLWPRLRAPLYATPFTAFLLREKLREKGLLERARITEIPLNGGVSLGPFELTLLTLTHSIPEPNGVAIRTPLGTVLHTGDWKIDPDPLTGPVTDEAAIRALGDEGVLAMVCDSTNVFVDGEAGSEADVRRTLNALIGQLKGKVAAACFASNVARMDTIIRAGEAAGRTVCLVGRSMIRMAAAARSVGLLEGVGPFVSDIEAARFPDDRILYLCTGSQGEVRAALARIAAGTHPHVKLGKGDSCVFSSRIIPGNEIPIRNMQNKLADLGVRLYTERDHPGIHVSGHPCRDELKRMYQWARPHIAVPTHGERRHLLEHAALAKDLPSRRATATWCVSPRARPGSSTRCRPAASTSMRTWSPRRTAMRCASGGMRRSMACSPSAWPSMAAAGLLRDRRCGPLASRATTSIRWTKPWMTWRWRPRTRSSASRPTTAMTTTWSSRRCRGP
jgi:ribonuclease J